MASETKLMYFAPIPEGRAIPVFRKRWKQYVARTMGTELWEHVRRCSLFLSVTQSELGGAPPAEIGETHEESYGGVGALWVDDALDPRAFDEGLQNEALRVDEIDTFGRPFSALGVMAMREKVLTSKEPSAVILVSALKHAPELSREEFSEKWLAYGEEFLAEPELSDRCSSYVQNHAVESSADFDGIAEVGFSTIADFRKFAERLAGPGLGKADFIDYSAPRAVVTVANPIFDR
jgi:hypothetical protein